MAVNIDIPGVGRVQVEGVAAEDTMQQILAAIKDLDPKSGKSKSADATNAATKANEKQSAVLTRIAKTRADEEVKDAQVANRRRAATVQLTNDLKKLSVNLTTNVLGLATSFAVMHDKIASNPIGAAADMINVGIDMTNQAVKGASTAIGSLGEGIPVVGGIIKGMGEAAKAAADALAAAAKVANNFLSAELKKTTEAMKTFTAAGASFAGGLTEMRTVANSSGLNLKAFTDVIKNSRENITMMGLSASDASVQLGQGMQKTSQLVGRSGMTLRDEMLNMGYSYEEQGAIMASYMANMKTSGNLEKMSREEIARGTREYAKDLKVLADITGKDAKKAMEEAQKQSMMADIMAQLSPEEAKKFQSAYASMPDYAKKGFLEYVSSGGQAITDQATNIAMSQNAEVEKLIKGGLDNIRNASLDTGAVQRATLEQAARAGQAQRDLNKSQGNAIAMANRLGGSLGDAAKMQNDISASALYNADQVGKSGAAAENQATTADAASAGFAKATDAAMKFSIAMEDLATKALPKYSELLGNALQGMVDTLRKAGIDIPKTDAELAKDKQAQADATAKEEKQKILDAAVEKAKIEKDNAMKGASIWQKMGIGRTDEQKKAVEALDKAVEEADKLRGGAQLQTDENTGDVNYGASGGRIIAGPDSGYKPDKLVMHGTEAIVPLQDRKIPVEFTGQPIETTAPSAEPQQQIVVPDFAAAFSKVATLLTGSATDSKMMSVNSSKEFIEAQTQAFESVLVKQKELETTESGRAEFANQMKQFTDTLISLRQAQTDLTDANKAGNLDENSGQMITLSGRMVELLEQFITKQDETKREIERNREVNEMMRDLL